MASQLSGCTIEFGLWFSANYPRMDRAALREEYLSRKDPFSRAHQVQGKIGKVSDRRAITTAQVAD